jgi:hypothetical protein
MDIGLLANDNVAHCVVTLIPDDGSGPITIHQECEFSTSPRKGAVGDCRWSVASANAMAARIAQFCR